MLGNDRKASIQTSVYSEYEEPPGGSGRQLLTDWLKQASRRNDPSPRFVTLQRPNELPRFGKHKKSSIDNFTLGQIDDMNESSPGERMDTFPANEGLHRRSFEKLFLFDNKENNSLSSNFAHVRESTQQSKSFINAMRAIQEKCKRLESEKAKSEQECAATIQRLKEQHEGQKRVQEKLRLQLEQKAVEVIEMKSRIAILEKSSVDREKLVQQNERLRQEKARIERKLGQADKCSLQLSEKYSQATKQYEIQCRVTSDCELRVGQLQQLFNELKIQNQQLREKNGRLERSSTNNELISRFNSLVKRNEELSELLDKVQRDHSREKEEMKGEVINLQQLNSAEQSRKNKEIAELKKEKLVVEERLKQSQLTQQHLRAQMDKKNQQVMELVKSVISKASNKTELDEFKTAPSRHPKQNVIIEPETSRVVANAQTPSILPQSDWGYHSANQEKVTSRFEEPPTTNSRIEKVRTSSQVSKKQGKQKSIQKTGSKVQHKSYSKSLISSKQEQEPHKHHQSPRRSENLITFENPFGRISNKKSRRVVYASSQPRQAVPEPMQHAQIQEFDHGHYHSQYCEVHNPAHHICEQQVDAPEHQDLNKLMLIQAQKQAIALFDEHEGLLNASKECTSSSARAEYIGRLKQLNQQIRVNSEKICEYKMAFKKRNP